jgi:DNA-binding response OmpR family regulator
MLRSRSEIVIVLTDVDMPGSLDGFEFSRLVKQGWPEVGVLVISGKTQPGPGDLPPAVGFIQKPIRPAALVERIRALVPCRRRPAHSGSTLRRASDQQPRLRCGFRASARTSRRCPGDRGPFPLHQSYRTAGRVDAAPGASSNLSVS